MFILTQFIYRLSFGLALGMAVTSPRKVTSGYFRNHLYVLLGLNVLATIAALTAPAHFPWLPPVSAAVLSYVGSVLWLYEKRRAGIVVLRLVAAAALWGAWSTMNLTPGPVGAPPNQAAWWLHVLDPVTGGLVLGMTMAAMFLGHWYLNTPTMVLAPLERLVKLMALAIAARAVVCGIGLCLTVAHLGSSEMQPILFLLLRWLSGLVGAGLLTAMTWQTLKIPNTQSATGILYVAVIATFLGELSSLLLSQGSAYPL